MVAVAGMEGALASVLGGLVDKPVIAVPTSVGYGASMHGLSALLTMINSCGERDCGGKYRQWLRGRLHCNADQPPCSQRKSGTVTNGRYYGKKLYIWNVIPESAVT